MNVLVTGGAGFIGSNLVRALLADGDRVRVFDDLSTGNAANLRDVDDVDLIEGDIRRLDEISRAVKGSEVVYHLAARPSVARSVANPIGAHSVNASGTLNVMIASMYGGVSRVVYASSSSIYGDRPTLPKHEGIPPSPQSPYAASKLAGEAYCRAAARVYGVETVSLRFFNVFGPRQDPASEYAAVIPRFITRMLAGQRPEVHGDGRQSRDFTYIDNAVRACMLAAQAGSDAVGEAMNVACGDRITLLDLLETLNGLLDTRLEPMFTDPRPGDVRHSLADVEKARRLIGYSPEVSVSDGLAATVSWYRDRRPTVFEPPSVVTTTATETPG